MPDFGFKIDKPLPDVTEDGAPYWAATREGALKLQRCTACGHWRFPPSLLCPKCLDEGTEWTPVSGKGTVFSFIVVHRPQHPGFNDDAPYNVAIVELAEGVRMHGNVVECTNEQLYVGMPVELVLDKVNDVVTLPKWKPRAA